MSWQTITWDVARTGGFVAYGLVTVSVALGLILSLRWRTHEWPRWVTTDLHRYLTLLALVFTAVHTLAVWIDPFMAFGANEVFLPLQSHYRPIWTALGIVAAYLLLAIWLSERIQRLVGYHWWRRLHFLTFGIYGLVTVHGLATGSDTRTQWAVAIYAGSFLLVGSLLAIRLFIPGPRLHLRAWIAVAIALLALQGGVWTVSGPLRPDWNVLANNGHGSGARIALAQSSTSSSAAGIALPFSASLQGNATSSGDPNQSTVQIDATLSGAVQGSLRITLQGQTAPDGSLTVDRSNVVLSPSGSNDTYQGQLSSMNGGNMSVLVTDPAGNRARLDLQLQVDSTGTVSGSIQGNPA